MKQIRFLQLGWAAFLALAAVMVGVGFQTPTEKIGVADINRLMVDSDFGKSLQAQLDKMRAARQDLLSFIDSNRVITMDQAYQLRDLSLKPSLTKEEQAQLDSLKAAIVAASKKWTELATKPNMTPEERTLVQDYADRAQKMAQTGNRWVQDFSNDLADWAAKQKADGNQRARGAIQDVAKAQGYTMVYDSVFAPYGANDLTDAALAAMNAKK
ncbi:MAG TPA: OmpH family outer membrane protein [Fimbriimonas sp.]|nr:OmpH family outer membrane protein [Fimbriimonas sp.]